MERETCETGSWSPGMSALGGQKEGLLGTSEELSSTKQSKRFGFALFWGGFDSSEAFVGSMAGLAIWDRVLVPGEISNLAMGKALPTGAILTLDNATSVGGFVQRVNCTCLQLCP